MKQKMICLLILGGMVLASCTRGDVVVADFEQANYAGWTVQGEAFGNTPVVGAVGNQLPVAGFAGKCLVNSFHGGDDARGELLSPVFTIERDYVNFLLGGGMGEGVCVALEVGGKRVYETRPVVESETLQWYSWDVKAYRGQQARVRIIDNQRGGWGHILVDQIEMGDRAKSVIVPDYEMTFPITQKYLLVPIEDKGPESQVVLWQDGEKRSETLYIRVAQTQVDYWMPIDVETFKGTELTLRFQHVKTTDIGYPQIHQSDAYEFNYQEPYRPAYHFSPYYGWTNDPNGMVWHDGRYHLFYQHNPYGSMWANMHWGHAVSEDLVHWQHLGDALAPDSLGSIFSGSAVVDEHNTAGFGRNAIVVLFTSAGKRQTQSVAYSTDGGRTFTKYEGNPVLTDPDIVDFRDPKVFWHETTRQWVMALATSQTITFYASPDLKSWHKLSAFGDGIGSHGGVWECPDLFPLQTPDGRTKWVLLVSINPGGPNGGSATQYFIGDFDGRTFHADDLPYPLWVDYGRDNYAGVTWNNVPDGRRVFMGWMSNWDYANQVPTVNFRNAMTLPRDLSLRHNGEHLVLAGMPVHETGTLRGQVVEYGTLHVSSKRENIADLLPDNEGCFELEMVLVPNGAAQFGFGFTNSRGDYFDYTFDKQAGTLAFDRRKAGLSDFSDKFAMQVKAPLVACDEYRVRLFVDKASVELFVNDGELVMTNLLFPREVFNSMVFFSSDLVHWMVKEFKVWPLGK